MGWLREPERGKIELDYRAANHGTRYENVGGREEDDEKVKKQRGKNRQEARFENALGKTKRRGRAGSIEHPLLTEKTRGSFAWHFHRFGSESGEHVPVYEHPGDRWLLSL
ncbi:uncharacterized protein LOC122531584 [Frieseomelitta varia]|uniref:uncharacterized protein LOC122531584 n=1 Tax=Frieseomelitta varia TaxID=561572 RepID=UPI001CB69505|nr:uncharacterized protein LOC122531584 [Frieseomelitta varia]